MDLKIALGASLNPDKYTQGHTVIHALRAGGLRPIRYMNHGEDYSYSAAGRYYLRIADEEREVTSAERRQYMVCLKKIFIIQDRNWRMQHQNHWGRSNRH